MPCTLIYWKLLCVPIHLQGQTVQPLYQSQLQTSVVRQYAKLRSR